MNDLQFLGQQMGTADPAVLQKALTTASGFIGVNLEPTAKLMLPLFAGLRNRMPVDGPESGKMGGTQAQWRMQLGYGGFDFGGNMGTAFGGNGGALAGAALTVAADYASQSVNGDVQYESIPAARGFDDPLAIETSRGLASLVRLDELLTLGGNRAAIAAPVVVAGAAAPAGATFAVGAWTVQVSALTKQGMLTNAGIVDSHVGESAPSAPLAIVVPAGGATYLDISWPAVPNAFGYKVYCDVAAGGGAPLLMTRAGLTYADSTAMDNPTGHTIGVNRVRISLPAVALSPAPTAGDGSASALQFEGLASWCQKTTIYGTAVGAHSNIDMLGQPLTVGAAGINQFDTVLANLWSTWNISPSLIVTSPNGAAAVTAALMGATGILNYWINASQNQGNLTGGVYVGGYTNKFAGSMLPNQQTVIPVWAHPYCDDGTFLFLSETVPYQYSREARGFALDVQTPYTYFELGRTTRTFPFDIFFTETLKCYIPPAQASIQGARVQ